MALIRLYYSIINIGVRAGEYEYEDQVREEYYDFNTVTKTVDFAYQEFWESQQIMNGTYGDYPQYSAGTKFYEECVPNTTTNRLYLSDGDRSFTTSDVLNSPVCGYVAPEHPAYGTFIRTQCYGFDLYNVVADGNGGEVQGELVEFNSASCGYVPPPACDLVPAVPYVDGNKVQLAAVTSYPPVYYSLNGGEFYPVAEYFNLPPGTYTVDYRDSSPSACTARNSFEIAEVISGINYSRNPFWHQVQAPLGTLVDLELWVESEHYKGDYRLVVTQTKAATDANACFFRLDPVLSRLVKAEPPAGNAAVFCKSTILNYYVRYRLSEGVWYTSTTSTVLLGGMPLEDVNLVPFGHFLTSHQRTKRINKAHPEYLYWLCSGAHTTIKIRRGTYTAGVAEPVYVVEELTDIKPNRLLMVPAFGNLAANVTRADVTILGADDVPLSETRVYQLDPHPMPEERCYLFHNSWGGFDTLRCTGFREEQTSAKEEIGELDLQHSWQLQAGQRFVFSQTASRKIKQSTGPNPEWRQQYLNDFVLSAARYEVSGVKLLPLILSKFTLDNSTRDGRQGYSFEYDYAFDLVGYAKTY